LCSLLRSPLFVRVKYNPDSNSRAGKGVAGGGIFCGGGKK
jgi:hypothetical protein